MIIKPGYAGIAIELSDDAIIADIGSGHNPLPQATYCIEKDMEESPERSGLKTVIPKCKLIIADVTMGIPLPDKSCDFVVASHILEHIEDPIAFCKELERIGKAGYIETPGPWQEWINNKKVHKWIVSNENGILVFRKKSKFKGEPSTKIAAFIIDIIE
jgi:ubiquinone/menaquinone biosynthesis C-methylase UbiE